MVSLEMWEFWECDVYVVNLEISRKRIRNSNIQRFEVKWNAMILEFFDPSH